MAIQLRPFRRYKQVSDPDIFPLRKKGYGWIDFMGDDGDQKSRKLSYKVRGEVLALYIRRRSGRKFVVRKLAELFAVSERTMQKHLADLEAAGWIKRQACFDEAGKQNGNVIVYTGPKKRLTGDELTLEKIIDPSAEDSLDWYD